MIKFRDGAFGPTVVLFVICFFITLALAATHRVTKPLIEQADIEAANQVRGQVLPAGQGFSKLEGLDLPAEVLEVYRADNGAGYVVKAQAKGFDGMVTFMFGFGVDGAVEGINMFDHTETPGLGTKIGEMGYLQNYYGSVDVQTVEAVTGATKTSNALKNALAAAQSAVVNIDADVKMNELKIELGITDGEEPANQNQEG